LIAATVPFRPKSASSEDLNELRAAARRWMFEKVGL
jgi:hypothetical protein